MCQAYFEKKNFVIARFENRMKNVSHIAFRIIFLNSQVNLLMSFNRDNGFCGLLWVVAFLNLLN